MFTNKLFYWMRKLFLLVITILCVTSHANAQKGVFPKQMTYLSTAKPNSIFYNDTFYNGSKAFRKLFYNTKDPEIIELYYRHQLNKVFGSGLGTIGTIALTAGVIYASGDHPNISRGTGWALVGTGLLATITGGYLLKRSTTNLLFATYFFNKRYVNPKAAIGISGDGVSFVVKL